MKNKQCKILLEQNFQIYDGTPQTTNWFTCKLYFSQQTIIPLILLKEVRDAHTNVSSTEEEEWVVPLLVTWDQQWLAWWSHPATERNAQEMRRSVSCPGKVAWSCQWPLSQRHSEPLEEKTEREKDGKKEKAQGHIKYLFNELEQKLFSPQWF